MVIAAGTVPGLPLRWACLVLVEACSQPPYLQSAGHSMSHMLTLFGSILGDRSTIRVGLTIRWCFSGVPRHTQFACGEALACPLSASDMPPVQ